MRKGWKNWDFSAWRREGFGVTQLQLSSTWRGPTRKMERDFLQEWHRVTVLGKVDSNWVTRFRFRDYKKKKKSLLWRQWDTGIGFPEKLILHPWKCLESGWMEFSATWSNERCAYPKQGAWNSIVFKVPSNLGYSMILLLDNWTWKCLPSWSPSSG